jgi:DNA primase
MSNLRINKTNETVKLIKSLIDPVTVYGLLGLNIHSQTSEEIRAKCPFHQGKNPTSFRFKKQTGNWICFSNGCHEGAGDIVGLVMKKLDLSFSDAVAYLASIVGVDLDEEGFGLDKEKPSRVKNSELSKAHICCQKDSRYFSL